MSAHPASNAAHQSVTRRARRLTRITLLALLTLFLSLTSSAGTLPLNTGYDYSNWNTYAAGTPDDYWIRIASYPPMTPPVGPSWAVLHSGNGAAWAPPLAGPTGIPSMWINAFGNTNASHPAASAQNPAYALYRKCFCLPPGYLKPSIRGSARNDEAIQIWLNSVLNTVLPPSPININGAPYQINYGNASAFRAGRNCLFVLVEDTGRHTGFDLAANLNVANVTPLIAKGPNMSFEPCSCGHGLPTAALRRAEAEDRQVVQAIIKLAEESRLKRDAPPPRED